MTSLSSKYAKDVSTDLKLPPLTMTVKSFMPTNTRVRLQDCEMCGKKTSNEFCVLCGYNFCEECSKKKINNQCVCDYCFLKQFVKKSPLEKEEMFRSLQDATQKMNNQIKEYDDEIEAFKNQMMKIEVQETQKDKADDVIQMQNKIKSLKQKYASRKDGLEERKKKLKQRKGEIEVRSQKNQNYEAKLDNIRKDISQKQVIQLVKMEQLDKLKLQLETLQKQRKEVLRDLKQ